MSSLQGRGGVRTAFQNVSRFDAESRASVISKHVGDDPRPYILGDPEMVGASPAHKDPRSLLLESDEVIA